MNFLRSLQCFKVLNGQGRVSSVDVFRGLAILAVVFFHINMLPYGYLGVDLFFVISGFLVGGILVNAFSRNEPIQYLRFIFTRGFKIWPSYYLFFLFGQIIAFLIYRKSHPDQLIPFRDWPMYLLFYRNYRGGFHWSFDHVWSLCVEEHFYIMLPIVFIAVQRWFSASMKPVILGVLGLLSLGVIGKFVGYHIHFETYAATHNRLDALAWGVLLFIVSQHYGIQIRKPESRLAIFGLFALLFAACIGIQHSNQSDFFNKTIFHSLVPLAFSGMLFSTLGLDCTRFTLLRIFGYYSYNWYLWHPLFVKLLADHFKPSVYLAIFYVFGTFAMAVFFTILIEEPFMRMRSTFLNRFFARQKTNI